MPVIRIRDIVPGRTETFYDGEFDVAFLVKRGDILVGMDGDFNCEPWAGEPALLNQRVCMIAPDESRYDKQFLRYVLPGYLSAINAETPSVTVKHLSSRTVADIPLPLPPLTEQRSIVAVIEKQFARLDVGIAALRRAQANLKRYRAAVLKAACEGTLVAAEAMWPQIPLKKLIGGIGQGWSPKCEMNRDALPDEWAIITTTAVQPMRYIDNQGKPLRSTFEGRPHIEIKVGDFLMTRKGPRRRAGVACLVRTTRTRLMVCDTVYRFRCDESRIAPEYLEVALNSPSVIEAIDRQKAGISESGVSLTHDKLGAVFIPLPPLAEQTQIVAEVARRLSVIDQSEAAVNTNLQRTTGLRNSILQMAFAGELI